MLFPCGRLPHTFTTDHTPHCAHTQWPLGDELIDLACYDVVRAQRDTSRLQCSDDTFCFCSPFRRHRFAVALEALVPVRNPNDQPSAPEVTIRQLKPSIEGMMRIHYTKRVKLVRQEPGEFEFGCQTSVIRGESIVE